jgi:hypothetical protein
MVPVVLVLLILKCIPESLSHCAMCLRHLASLVSADTTWEILESKRTVAQKVDFSLSILI